MLNNALDSLPKTLDETYNRILQTIPHEYKRTTLRILQFLTFSKRPLRIEEVVDVIAVNVKGRPYFSPQNKMPEPKEIMLYCSSLVILVSKREPWEHSAEHTELHLAHFSVKEYLTSGRTSKDITHFFQDTDASASIARICVAYLLHFDNRISPKEARNSFPFTQYSARFWVDHARVAESGEQEIMDLIERLLCYEKDSYKLCYNLYRPDQPWNNKPDEDKEGPAPPLYYMALGGLRKVVKLLLDKGADPNAQGGFYGNALQAASEEGHEQVVKLLLDKGADPNAQGEDYGNALQAASSGGHEQVVKLLLNNGADPNAQSGDYDNALYAASLGGHEQVVKLLLDKGADPNAQGGFYGNALYAASEVGYEQVVKLLLDKGADPNAHGRFYGNALQAASEGGHEQVVKLLLDKGADPNAQDGDYGNALQAASEEGHEQVVKLLLDKGADVNVQGGYFGNALQAALIGGHEQVVKLLLNKGANVKAKDESH
jgi:ankyrin repeat protein